MNTPFKNTYPFKSELFTSFDDKLCKFIFIIIGCFSSISWTCIAQVANLVGEKLYGDHITADILIIISETTPLFSVLLFTLIGSARTTSFLFIIFISTLCSILVPLTIFLSPSLTLFTRYALYILAGIMGLNLGFMFSTSFTIASLMPQSYTGNLAFGGGLNQLISFICALISAFSFTYTNADPSIVKYAILIYYFPMCCLGVISFFCMCYLLKKSWFKLRLDTYWNKRTDSSIEYKSFLLDSIPIELQEERTLTLILRDSIKVFPCVFLIIWSNFLMYPLISPYSWMGSTNKEILLGVYQIADFIGRYLSNFVRLFNLKDNPLIVLTIFRFLSTPIFILPAILINTIFNNFIIQICLIFYLGSSTGIAVVGLSRNAPLAFTRLKEKGKIGTILALLSQIAVTLGVYSSKGFKEIL